MDLYCHLSFLFCRRLQLSASILVYVLFRTELSITILFFLKLPPSSIFHTRSCLQVSKPLDCEILFLSLGSIGSLCRSCGGWLSLWGAASLSFRRQSHLFWSPISNSYQCYRQGMYTYNPFLEHFQGFLNYIVSGDKKSD